MPRSGGICEIWSARRWPSGRGMPTVSMSARMLPGWPDGPSQDWRSWILGVVIMRRGTSSGI